MIYGAIDIGSNAGRLLIGNTVETGKDVKIKKILLTRVPLRLGEDVFTDKKIGKERLKKLIKTIKAYKNLMEVYEVSYYKAVATSAMREAENRKEVIKEVKNETGIELEIIDGETEAEILFSNFFTQKLDKNKNYLYIDVGGGSTEVSLLKNGEKLASRSFKIGTIRMLKDKVADERWIDMKDWLKGLGIKEAIAIGTGGNINRILKLHKTESDILTYVDIKKIQAYIASYSFEDRVNVLGLRPDRADVILPASDIYLAIMKYAGVNEMLIPKIGLTDGLIYSLHMETAKEKVK
jgi:exopolyphosphatase/guanosine-5'-triphosphate,3'-diphosphate pyrophosphatase